MPTLVDLRNTILRISEIGAFSHSQDQKHALPRRSIAVPFTSMSRRRQDEFNAALCAISGLTQRSKRGRYSITSSARASRVAGRCIGGASQMQHLP